MSRLSWFTCAMLLTCSCAAFNPQRLDEQVAMYHDDLRWGRLPAATQFVAARNVARFLRRHARWTRDTKILDVETEAIETRGVVSTVRTRFAWTLPDEVEIRETVLETRWRSIEAGRWLIDDERVVSGDPSLLASGDPPSSPNATPSPAATPSPDATQQPSK